MARSPPRVIHIGALRRSRGCVPTLVHTLGRLRGSDTVGVYTVADDGAAREWRLGELVAAAEAVAARLIAAGVRRGERVAIAAPDPAYLLVTLLGAIRCGAASVNSAVVANRPPAFLMGHSESVSHAGTIKLN